MPTRKDCKGVRPSPYWVTSLLVIGLFAVSMRQWQRNTSLRRDNQRLEEQLGSVEDINAENIELRSQRAKLLSSQEAEAQQIGLLRAEVQRLRERTNELGNELGVARLHQARFRVETKHVEGENRSLKAELASKPRIPRVGAWLGVSIRDIDEEERKQNALSGVVVLSVVAGSPAQKASLEPGDLVLSVDGQTVTGTDDFKSIMVQKTGGQLVALEVVRKDSVVRVDVKPLDWPQ